MKSTDKQDAPFFKHNTLNGQEWLKSVQNCVKRTRIGYAQQALAQQLQQGGAEMDLLVSGVKKSQ
jgi:hypothetical protein